MKMRILQEERKICYGTPIVMDYAREEMMDALGKRLMEVLSDLPKGKDARVSYMEARSYTGEESILMGHYKIQLAVQEIPGRPEVEVEPTVIKGNDVAGGMNSKEP